MATIMGWNILLDKASDIPLYHQLSNSLAELIIANKISADAKLPPIRQMARALDVNTTTVVNAYKKLEQRRLVYSITGSGTYAAKLTHAATPHTQTPLIGEDFINFAQTATEAAFFPVTAFKRAFDIVMDRDGGTAFGYHEAHGYDPLRESACKLIGDLGIKSSLENIHIISTAKHGLDIMASTLLSAGDMVFVEQPASHVAVAAFAGVFAKIIEMPMAKDGPDFVNLEVLLKKHRPKLFYVTPNYQHPKGICYSYESKRRLLQLAHEIDAYIIEEDQLSDFYYDGSIKTPLKALDDEGRVIFIKGFSRILTPGIGIGFLVCHSNITATKPYENNPPGYTQRVFDCFLRSGDYELHTANMRTMYARRYLKMTTAVSTYLAPFADFVLPGGGLSLWVTPHVPGDYTGLFIKKKIAVSPGQLFSADMQGFRLSFAAVSEDRIAEGIGAIASVLHTHR